MQGAGAVNPAVYCICPDAQCEIRTEEHVNGDIEKETEIQYSNDHTDSSHSGLRYHGSRAYKVKAGEMISISEQPEGGYDAELSVLKAESLNEFIISKAQNCDSRDKLCFTQDELNKVIDDRAAERKAVESADGDASVWIYTCNGLGADVGGDMI